MDWHDGLAIAAFVVSFASLGISIAAFVRKGRWRQQDRAEALPDFAVTVHPYYAMDAIGTVECLAENTSTGDATITRVGITPVNINSIEEFFDRAGNTRLPHALPSGHHLQWTLPGTVFTELLEALPQSPPEDPQFAVYVESGLGADIRRWTSHPFTVRPRMDS